MNDPEADRELRELLRAADPARNLTEPTMLELTEAPMSTSPSPSRPNRTRLLVAAAAAAVVLATGIGIVIGHDDDNPVAQAPKPSPTRALTTSTYTFGASGAAGRCMVPNQNGIRDLDVAFVGKVVDRTDHRVLLIPSEYFTGDKVERVELDVSKAEGAIYEVLPVDFQVGKQYIVAVKQGQVRLCGYTTEVNPSMLAKYRSALGAG